MQHTACLLWYESVGIDLPQVDSDETQAASASDELVHDVLEDRVSDT